MRDIASAIQNFFGDKQDLSAYLAAMAAIGVAAMALLQAAKDVFPLRRNFHENSLQTWMALGTREAEERFAPILQESESKRIDTAQAAKHLVALSVDGDK